MRQPFTGIGSLLLFVIVLFAAIPATCPVASAQSLQRIFSSANEAYFRGDYAAAAGHYEQLVQAGVNDPDVYYNLATAHARAGRLGKAVLFFERSLKADPGDPAAEAALSACRDALGKRRAEKKGEALVRTRPPLSDALVRPFSENALAMLVLVFDLAFFLALIAIRFANREAVRVALGVTAPLLGLLLVLSGLGLAVKSEAFKEGRAGIVLGEEAPVREGPDPRAQIRTRALEGQSARILAREGGFVRVRLAGGAEGWIRQAEVGEI